MRIKLKNLDLPAWLIVLAVVAVLLLALASILRFLTPQPKLPTPTVVKENTYGGTSVFSQVSYIGEEIKTPSKLPVYSSKSKYIGDDLKNKLIKKYQLAPLAHTEAVMNGPEYSLVTYKAENKYSLTLTNALDSRQKIGKFEPEKIIIDAESFLKEVFPENQFKVMTNNIKYITSLESRSFETTIDKADLAAVNFTYFLSDFPLSINKSQLSPAAVVLHKSGKVISADFQPYILDFAQIEQVSSISVDQAVANINANAGLASIISSNSDSITMLDLATINMVVFSKVEIEYRLDTSDNIASPYYRFYGSATDNRGEKITLEVITPAVLTEQKEN